MKKIFCLLLICCLLFSGCGTASETATRQLFAMDTYMTVTCYGKECEAAADAAVEEIRRLDELLSVGNEESEISRLNASGQLTLSEDSLSMLREAFSISEKTSGAFDITLLPLMELWGFTSGEYRVPEETELEAALSTTGMQNITLSDDGTVLLSGGCRIDLGGIAKGYTSGRLAQVFENYRITGAVVSLGGNVQFYGSKPDGSSWRAGIRDPFSDDSSAYFGKLTTDETAVITSGAYERYFTGEDGTVYHHILDPETGCPARSGLVSVTVVSENSTQADALSTACFVLGKDAAFRLWRTSGLDFDLILVTEDGNVYITEPLRESFTSDYPVTVLQRDGSESPQN